MVGELLFHKTVSYHRLHCLGWVHTESLNHLSVKSIVTRKPLTLFPGLCLVVRPKIHRQIVEELKNSCFFIEIFNQKSIKFTITRSQCTQTEPSHFFILNIIFFVNSKINKDSLLQATDKNNTKKKSNNNKRHFTIFFKFK